MGTTPVDFRKKEQLVAMILKDGGWKPPMILKDGGWKPPGKEEGVKKESLHDTVDDVSSSVSDFQEDLPEIVMLQDTLRVLWDVDVDYDYATRKILLQMLLMNSVFEANRKYVTNQRTSADTMLYWFFRAHVFYFERKCFRQKL